MSAPERNGTERLQLKIGGMSCSFCVSSITKAMERTEGVRKASVNLAHEEALIEYEPDKVEPEVLEEIIRDLGYTVRDPEKVRTFGAHPVRIGIAGRNCWFFFSGDARLGFNNINWLWHWHMI